MARSKNDKKHQVATSEQKAASVRVDPPHVIADGRIAEGETPASVAQGASLTTAADSAAQPALEAVLVGQADSAAGADQATPADAAVLVQQVRTHAAQLATHLRRQQSELDHREAELNARTAGMDSEVRSARLWLSERQEELAEQKTSLDEREHQLAARLEEFAKLGTRLTTETGHRSADIETREQVLQCRLAELAAAEANWQEVCQKADRELTARSATLDRRLAQLDERQTELDLRSASLDTRELDYDLREAQLDSTAQELKRRAAELAQQVAAGEHALELQAQLDLIANRRENLDEAERILSEQQGEVARERHELIAKRDAVDEMARADRKKLADFEREARAELDKKRQSLRRRSDDLDARRGALKQLRSEVVRTQREVLEMRLATEELWAKLCGTMAPAALTQSLSQIRSKLADQNRLATIELAEQKSELQALAARVHEQHEKSARQKQELQDWMARRQREIEEQAAHLVAREQQLDAQETEFGRRELAWQDERFGFQQEIRKLLRQLRRSESMAA